MNPVLAMHNFDELAPGNGSAEKSAAANPSNYALFRWTNAESLSKMGQRFRQQTAAQLEQAEASVSDEAGERLLAFIAEGARTLEEDEASESQVNEAGRTLERFVKLLIEEGRGPEGNVRIGEAEFNRVSAGFCPFYPFC